MSNGAERLTTRDRAPQRRTPSRVLDWLLFTTALFAAMYTLLSLMGIIGTLKPADVPYIFALDAALALLLLGLVGFKLFRLLRDKTTGKAGAKLHLRIVLMLGLATALPTALVAGAAMVVLDQGLKPWFSGNLKVLVENAGSIATQYQQQLCQNVVREMRLMSADVERAYTSGLYDKDRTLFREFLTSRAIFLGLPNATIMRADGSVVEKANVGIEAGSFTPSEEDIALAGTDEPPCILSQDTLGTLTRLKGFDAAYLVVGRPIDKKAVEFPLIAQLGVEQYQGLDSRREATTLGIGVVFVMVTLLVLLAAIVLGLSFADRIAQPIGRLIQATDEVSSGNLYVQVPVAKVNDDISHLGSTFNKMTSVLRSQHDSLIEANTQNDERRRFMEAVLSGVPAGVLGLDTNGIIRISNPTAEALLGSENASLVGKPMAAMLPQIALMLDEVRAGNARLLQQTIEVSHGTRDRTISVRVAPENAVALEKGLVVTLDDITDLVTAQRTSAWADVARRIAHEIKNPLTPIQLSAERIRRKFGRVITEDKHVFDQCTDTIVRQVEDIKQMVDEFSSFARTPRPVIADEDVTSTVREVLFMMRVAHPAISFEEIIPAEPMFARFDRRLIAQAVQNIIKNATEAIDAVPQEKRGEPVIRIRVEPAEAHRVAVDVIDTGKGFPADNRARLLEPYMTDRQGGTGLGLAIVAKILEEHGGGIELKDSPYGRGAWVRLLLPGAEDAQNAADRKASA